MFYPYKACQILVPMFLENNKTIHRKRSSNVPIPVPLKRITR